MRTFCLGDCHGAHKALVQVLERSKFDYAKDKLICLGDVCDGWPETKQCFDELLKIKNLVFIMGNHDKWLLDFIQTRKTPNMWVSQGGKATLASYGYKMPYIDPAEFIPIQHKELLENAKYYHVENNKAFVHAGFPFGSFIADTPNNDLMWDRELLSRVRLEGKDIPHYDEVYIGHTTTWYFSQVPYNKCNLWALDQGGGYEGKLSLLDIDSKEFFQSDIVSTLYDTHNGREI